jgi:hypothetical protein
MATRKDIKAGERYGFVSSTRHGSTGDVEWGIEQAFEVLTDWAPRKVKFPAGTFQPERQGTRDGWAIRFLNPKVATRGMWYYEATKIPVVGFAKAYLLTNARGLVPLDALHEMLAECKRKDAEREAEQAAEHKRERAFMRKALANGPALMALKNLMPDAVIDTPDENTFYRPELILTINDADTLGRFLEIIRKGSA